MKFGLVENIVFFYFVLCLILVACLAFAIFSPLLLVGSFCESW